jgi:cAMP-dependent protein kinase regulator
LDRQTFNHIIKESAINKREKYKKFLETIPLLSTVESYELYSICDVIKMKKYEKNQYIIKEGEKGDKFFILDEGEAVATKEKMTFKKKYYKGDYFGELALLRNAPRAASVMAVTDCKVLTLDRPAFKRLLGPLEDILKRNSEAYEKYAKA